MNLISKIPRDFYKLFASKYMEFYMQFLVALYIESSQSYSLLGLTEGECRSILNEKLAVMTIDWSEARFDEEGEFLTRSNMASVCLKHFEDWGWLIRDYDETLNSYVVSFPEYSQMFVELFQQLYSDDEGKERESVLAVYSYLYTYSADPEKNNEILKSALRTSKSLLQMLANMQEGMRGYFDELSKQRSFLGIQEVLVKEINNSDSQKYAILTTTDSFYRYKEAVKELIDKNLSENELRRQDFEQKRDEEKQETIQYFRMKRGVEICEEASTMLYQISREFDAIERRYNRLIEQKTVFANRAAARIRYILMEGATGEDQTARFISLLNNSVRQNEILERLSEKMRLTTPYRSLNEKSFYRKKDYEKEEFRPQAVLSSESEENGMEQFVLKPLYTNQEIQEFRKKNQKDGYFRATDQTVQSVEDLEKLFMVWQDATQNYESDTDINVGNDRRSETGFKFSELTIKEQ